jgi:hypothetical protein
MHLAMLVFDRLRAFDFAGGKMTRVEQTATAFLLCG